MRLHHRKPYRISVILLFPFLYMFCNIEGGLLILYIGDLGCTTLRFIPLDCSVNAAGLCHMTAGKSSSKSSAVNVRAKFKYATSLSRALRGSIYPLYYLISYIEGWLIIGASLDDA
jgi:hypothetical protein